MTEKAKYLYCIIEENKNQSFGSIGINNQEVNLVHYKDIAAVVSATPIRNFDRLDKKELTRHVAAHQKVQEVVMKDYDVCPMTFGIIAPSIDEVSRILERVYLQFKTALKKIEGKAEFVIQVRWNKDALLSELANTNPEIQKLKGVNVLGMPIKLKLGKLIFQEIEAQREDFIKEIPAFLNNLVHDSTQNKLIEEDMIANFSFLIEKTKEPELDSKMQELGKKYEGKLRFKYIGPMSPYSFVNINLGLGNFELINEARKLLGLAEEATFDEIKRVYFALAHRYHPHKHQGDLEKEEQMKKIVHAYSILEDYCQSCNEIFGKKEDSKYSFKEKDVKNSIMINYD